MMRVVVGKSAGVGVGAEELRWEDITAEELGTLASTASLLGDTQTFVLTGALSGERGDEFISLAKGLVLSPHTFIFEEEKLLKKPSDALAKAGVKAEVQEKKKAAEWKFDQFGVAAALGNRDKKKLWLGVAKSLRAGEKPEAIAGLLAWKARNMKDAALSREIVTLYHDSHRGAGDLELLLEQFVLTL
ncbi:MAG: hypothetical protein NT019_01275 [Candidatus Adlerbacteria bacterium]|nr:hypothetical protein [Candidatus Adlerbacteria bacterium]